MKRFEFQDDSLKKIFETLKRVPAPEKVVQKLYRKISNRSIPHTASIRGVRRALFSRRRAVMAAVLTLLITVPVTFSVTRLITSDIPETRYIVRFIYRDETADSGTLRMTAFQALDSGIPPDEITALITTAARADRPLEEVSSFILRLIDVQEKGLPSNNNIATS